MDDATKLEVLRTLGVVISVALDRVDAERQNPAHNGSPTLDIFAGLTFGGMAQALAGSQEAAEALVAQLRPPTDA